MCGNRWLALVCCASAAAAAPPPLKPDTARLAAHLKVHRGELAMSAETYSSVQAEFVAWIDARMLAGEPVAEMNRELKTAGVLRPPSKEPPDYDDWTGSHAGQVDEISTRTPRGAKEIVIVVAGIYSGANCAYDSTAIVYRRSPVARLAAINAFDQDEIGFYLSGIDVGERDAAGRCLVASGWVASNCTSTWNGKRIRIDRVGESGVENLLARDLSARDRWPRESVAARVQQNVVTFFYDRGVPDDDLLSTSSIARYRVEGDRPIRQAPMALTRAGFIAEWLQMAEDDAVRWSEPEAMARRKEVAAATKKHNFEWIHFGRCGGSTAVFEAAVQVKDSKKRYVFRIAGARATGLRMLAVTNDWSRSCRSESLEKTEQLVGSELPW